MAPISDAFPTPDGRAGFNRKEFSGASKMRQIRAIVDKAQPNDRQSSIKALATSCTGSIQWGWNAPADPRGPTIFSTGMIV